jgi:cytochrome d ubiquinol oxidase subunit II
LFVAFPRVLAAGLSGFYLAIFLVIWTLILRAVAIEFRSHVPDGLWRSFWDTSFCVASIVLPVLFGAAIGNVIRGLPLTSDGWFQLTLFTDSRTGPEVGILDWYTVLTGGCALVALAGHGATFLAWRTDGEVHDRSRRVAGLLFPLLAVLWPIVTWATYEVNPDLLRAMPGRPLAWVGVLLAAGGLFAVFLGLSRARPLMAFLGSSAWITGMLVATAACLFPVMLRATTDPALSITAYNAGGSAQSLRVATGWWVIGFPIAIAYFVTLFRLHRRKVTPAREGEGY